MQKWGYKNCIVFLICGILFSSCSEGSSSIIIESEVPFPKPSSTMPFQDPTAQAIRTHQAVETQNFSITQTMGALRETSLAPTSTLTPITPIGIKTPTVVPSLTLTLDPNVPTKSWSQIPPLSKVIVNINDKEDEYYVLADFYSSPGLDVTSEIGNACELDCVKRVWSRTGYVFTVILIRTNNVDGAYHALEYQWEIFSNYEEDDLEYYVIDDFTGGLDTLWSIGMTSKFIYARTYGSVFIMLFLHLTGIHTDIDGAGIELFLKDVGDFQVQKLINAGYPP